MLISHQNYYIQQGDARKLMAANLRKIYITEKEQHANGKDTNLESKEIPILDRIFRRPDLTACVHLGRLESRQVQ